MPYEGLNEKATESQVGLHAPNTNARKLFLLGFEKTSGAVVCEEVTLTENEWPIAYLNRRVAEEATKKETSYCFLMTIDASVIGCEQIKQAFVLGLNSQAWVTGWGKGPH